MSRSLNSMGVAGVFRWRKKRKQATASTCSSLSVANSHADVAFVIRSSLCAPRIDHILPPGERAAEDGVRRRCRRRR